MVKRVLLCSALGLVCALSPAHAQSVTLDDLGYGDLVVFGDSLSDNGNAFTASGGTTPPPPYFGGRFSNGPVWTELLGETFGAGPFGAPPPTGSQNYAFGGAWTTSTGASPVPDIPDQVATFLGTGGTFTPDDIVTIWGGANNYFGLLATTLPANLITAISAGAPTDASALLGDISTLIANGATNIIVPNLPDLGSTALAQVQGSQTPGTLYTQIYNQALAQGLAALKATNPGVNFFAVDAQSLVDEIIDNPGAFGLTTTSTSCIPIDALGNPTGPACSNPDEYLFWDGVHPTAVVHADLAQIVLSTLVTAGGTTDTASMAELGLWTRQWGTDVVFNRLDDVLGRRGPEVKTGMFAAADVANGSWDDESGRPGYDYTSYNIRGGFDFRASPNVILGFAFGAAKSDVDEGLIEYQGETFEIDAFAGFDLGAAFLKTTAGIGFGDLRDYERSIGVGSLKNTNDRTEVVSYSAAAELGSTYALGNVRLSPSLGLEYVHSTMSGFTEEGVVAPVNYEDRDVTALIGDADLVAAYLYGPGPVTFAWSGRVGYEDFLDVESDDVEGRLADGLSAPFSTEVDDPDGKGVNVGIGWGAYGQNAYFAFDVGYDFNNDNGDGQRAQIRLGLALN